MKSVPRDAAQRCVKRRLSLLTVIGTVQQIEYIETGHGHIHVFNNYHWAEYNCDAGIVIWIDILQ